MLLLAAGAPLLDVPELPPGLAEELADQPQRHLTRFLPQKKYENRGCVFLADFSLNLQVLEKCNNC